MDLSNFELAGGAWIFLAFLIVGFFSVVWGWYTVRGSGISETPYGKIYGGAPGANGRASASGKDERASVRDWSRGTR
jgi:hypothetical protein